MLDSPVFRRANADDAVRIAMLHADSWRRHYRGALSDAFLDGDVVADRLSVWSARLAAPGATETVLAEHDGELVGFVHVIFDEDPRWGSLVDNLHVVRLRHRTGLGTHLLSRAARAAARQATDAGLYLWVLEQNTAARSFYDACGAVCAQTDVMTAPGGDPSRLNGAPGKLRMVWPDASRLADHLDQRTTKIDEA